MLSGCRHSISEQSNNHIQGKGVPTSHIGHKTFRHYRAPAAVLCVQAFYILRAPFLISSVGKGKRQSDKWCLVYSQMKKYFQAHNTRLANSLQWLLRILPKFMKNLASILFACSALCVAKYYIVFLMLTKLLQKTIVFFFRNKPCW